MARQMSRKDSIIYRKIVNKLKPVIKLEDIKELNILMPDDTPDCVDQQLVDYMLKSGWSLAASLHSVEITPHIFVRR